MVELTQAAADRLKNIVAEREALGIRIYLTAG